MKSPFQFITLTVGASLFAASALKASVDSTVKVDVTYRVQKATSSSGPNDYGSVRAVRLGSKTLIVLVGKQLGTRFPAGSQLKADLDGRVFVTDSRGKVLADASKFLRAKLVSDERLFDGRVNRETGAEGSRSFFPVAFTITLPGLKGSVEGIGTEDFHVSSPNRDGVQIVSGEIDSTVAGKGSVNSQLAYYTGTLNFKGRKAIIAE